MSVVWVILLFITGSSGNALDEMLLLSAFWMGLIFMLLIVPSLLFALVIEFLLHKFETLGLKLALIGGILGFFVGSTTVLITSEPMNSLVAGSFGFLLGSIIASVMGRHYQRHLASFDVA